MEPNNYRGPGFLANGVHVGIKTDGRPDLSLLYSTRPAAAAGVFTTNCFKAAPVLIATERIKIVEGVKGLVAGLHEDGIPAAEAGIMTTDRFPKIVSRKGLIGSKEVTLCGIAKGAGMIEPHMATMLAFVMTDADIEPEVLNVVFRQAAGGSFNAVTVDGCMSTNDTAIILANGLAGNPRVKRGSHDLGRFGGMLSSLMVELARELVRDGEGAKKGTKIAGE